MAFGTLLWKSVILTSVTLLLRDIAGIGSAPRLATKAVVLMQSSRATCGVKLPICFYRDGFRAHEIQPPRLGYTV